MESLTTRNTLTPSSSWKQHSEQAQPINFEIMENHSMKRLQQAVATGLLALFALTSAASATNTQTTPPQLTQAHIPYMQGYPDASIRPNQKITRAEMAQMIARLLETQGEGGSTYQDVSPSDWYYPAVSTLSACKLIDSAAYFRPQDTVTRAEWVTVLARFRPDVSGTAAFSDVPTNHWAAGTIGTAVSLGWIAGYPDGTFQPQGGLTRAEACVVLSRMTARTGDPLQTKKLLAFGLFRDLSPDHWAAAAMTEAAVPHTPLETTEAGESWQEVSLHDLTFTPGSHEWNGDLYAVNAQGKLISSQIIGSYQADAEGKLTQIQPAYVHQAVPYISQIDDIYAWVGCEAVSTLMGLQAMGYAMDVSVKPFLDALPRASSDPEKGFVGSPYVPDKTKKTRTTIYPAKLAEYANTYCGGRSPCADFRGHSVEDLKRELLLGNCVVGYLTLWWEKPAYRPYDIEGTWQNLVSNNHAVLICGYDPEKGYYISDPYNYHNRGEVYQYWQSAEIVEAIWQERQVGMVIRS